MVLANVRVHWIGGMLRRSIMAETLFLACSDAILVSSLCNNKGGIVSTTEIARGKEMAGEVTLSSKM